MKVITAFYLVLPMVFSGVLHMLFVKKGLLRSLQIPVNENLFGANKTWRGFVVMPLASIAGILAVRGLEPAFGDSLLFRFSLNSPWILGTLLGLAYVIFELPNSFVKRRLGVQPGTNPENFKLFFIAFDQVDSGFGCALVYFFYAGLDPVTCALFIVEGGLIHLVVNMGLHSIGLKKQRF